MTTRQATGYLPRAGEPGSGSARRSLADWAALVAIGAVQWPSLLRSLDGGRPEAKRALLDRLRLPHDALPNLGSWKADVGLLALLANHIFAHRPRLVVEFGMGASTLVIAQSLKLAGGGRLISFEQHEDYVRDVRNWLADHKLDGDLRAAKLRRSDRWPGRPAST
jgi:predicted O-methyltransferase YrrM